MSLKRWIDSVRFRFGTWRRAALRRRRARVRRLREPRPAGEVTVSAVVPVKNAGADLAGLITCLREQNGFRDIEVLVVDSGSTDGSAEAAEALGATVVRIAPAEFSHSYARNLGAERAAGDYVLFTVQDALPSSPSWLLSLFTALQRHEAAAASSAEQPRPDCDLFYRAISWNHGRFMSADGSDAVLFRSPDDSPLERRRGAQISDTACLIRRDLFLRYRHRGHYAEDLDLGLRLTADGYRLVYVASPAVVHSHNRPAWYHLRRAYVEHLALFDMLPGFPTVPGERAEVIADVVGSAADLDRVVEDSLDLPVPCTPERVRQTVARALSAVPGARVAVNPTRDYLDARTREFLAGLAERAPAGLDQRSGRLTAGADGVAGQLCAYLADAGRTLDRATLEDFKAALYKGWAQHCGVLLASVYWRGSQGVRDAMADLHEELTKEV